MANLKLIHTAEIVQLPVKEPSTFDQGWAARTGMMKKRGDGSDRTRKLWEKAAKKVGSARLLASLKRYIREEKEPTCGYPGLSVWLNGERYDHWLPDDSAAVQRQSPTYPQRAALVVALGEPFVKSYLDSGSFHGDGFFTPGTETAMRKLEEIKGVLKAAGIAGFRRKE